MPNFKGILFADFLIFIVNYSLFIKKKTNNKKQTVLLFSFVTHKDFHRDDWVLVSGL